MYEVYILKSISCGRYYIGYSKNTQKRLQDHNRGFVKSTKAYAPYKVMLIERYSTRGEAMRREKEIKKMKGGIQFQELIRNS